jgi:hypothetical protein
VNQGFQYTLPFEDLLFSVWYGVHFVERYEFDFPDRKAAKKSIKEDLIRQKLELALPQLAEIARNNDYASGIIVSLLDRFTMVTSMTKFQKGFQLKMVTIDPKVDLKPNSPNDFEIKVNPLFSVHFTEPFSPGIKIAVLSSLQREALTVDDDGTPMHLRSDLVSYWAERLGNKVDVMEAAWVTELYEIDVP